MDDYKIEVETTGDYKTKKSFNKKVGMTERQFMGLMTAILDYVDTLSTRESESQRQERIVRESEGENEYVGPTK